METVHEGSIAVSAPDGSLVAFTGDIDRPYYLRSAAKPFQALVSQRHGAGLRPVELALACASHRGLPAHLAIVEQMLARVGLDESHLGCPPDWPIHPDASDRLIRDGHHAPRALWHNCSGKHAAFLRACQAQGWDLASYLDPRNPLQIEVGAFLSELGRHCTDPVGVDGCGAPVHRTTARVMSLLFARLGNDPAYDDVFTVMHRYPSLVSANGEGDAAIATALHAAAKGGAAGCIGVSLQGGYGVAVKSWDGSHEVAVLAAVATLAELGLLNETAARALITHGRPDVLGGGGVVGQVEPRIVLKWA